MENPATWGMAEKIVQGVLYEHYANISKPLDHQVIGLSLERRITDALRAEGLLKNGTEEKTD